MNPLVGVPDFYESEVVYGLRGSASAGRALDPGAGRQHAERRRVTATRHAGAEHRGQRCRVYLEGSGSLNIQERCASGPDLHYRVPQNPPLVTPQNLPFTVPSAAHNKFCSPSSREPQQGESSTSNRLSSWVSGQGCATLTKNTGAKLGQVTQDQVEATEIFVFKINAQESLL